MNEVYVLDDRLMAYHALKSVVLLRVEVSMAMFPSSILAVELAIHEARVCVGLAYYYYYDSCVWSYSSQCVSFYCKLIVSSTNWVRGRVV